MAAATGVSLDKNTLSLNVGDTERLTATVAPSDADDKTVSWISEDTTIASVTTAGLVTAKKAGSTKITVKTTDGDFTAEATVTVAEAIDVVSIEFKRNKFYSLVDVDTTLIPNVLPENYSGSLEWSSSHEDVATVDQSGKVSAIKLGSTFIRVVSANGIERVVEFLVVDEAEKHDLDIAEHIMSLNNRELSGYFQVLEEDEKEGL